MALPLPNVSRWVREYRQDQQDLSDNGITRKELEAENRRLKQENKRLEKATAGTMLPPKDFSGV